MKSVLLAAVFIIAISGFAAAQSTSAKQTTRQEKAVKKGAAIRKSNQKSTVLKQESSANAKSDSAVRLLLPVPKVSDTTVLPKVKNK